MVGLLGNIWVVVVFLILTVVDSGVDSALGVIEASMVVDCDVVPDRLEKLIPSWGFWVRYVGVVFLIWFVASCIIAVVSVTLWFAEAMNMMATIISEVEIIIAKIDNVICAIDLRFNLYKHDDMNNR